MGFSKEWNERYLENTHLSIWPWSDVVSLLHRHCKVAIASKGKVLELGCGAGANIPLFDTLGMDYHAIEGSEAIVQQLHEAFPKYKNQIISGDFTQRFPFKNKFDVILDRGSITCNTTESIRRVLKYVDEFLNDDGILISVDMYSSKHSDAFKGVRGADLNTRILTEGMFENTGNVHFSDIDHIKELYEGFNILHLEEKQSCRYIPESDFDFASWNIVAKKR